MNYLKNLLVDLHGGRALTLETRNNQHGEDIAIKSLIFDDGDWIISELNCGSSYDYGFGTCRCISHPTFRDIKVSRKEALSEIRTLLRNQKQDREYRDSEIKWLEDAIAKLEQNA